MTVAEMTAAQTESANAVKSPFLRSLWVTGKCSKFIAIGILILLLMTSYFIWNGELGIDVSLDDGTPVNPYLAAALFCLLIQLILSIIVLALSFPVTYALARWRLRKAGASDEPTLEAE